MFSQPASSFGSTIDGLFWLIFGIVGFWFLLAEFIFFYFCYKYRRKDGEKAKYISGEVKEQKKWITIPHFLVILCDVVLIAGTVYVWNTVKIEQPKADATIRVISQQWAWTFVHPGKDNQLDTADDVIKVDELHLKNDTIYHFELTSTDVVHSFSIPAFRLKQDAVPGRQINGWFKTTRTGNFDIQCAEMCGLGHGLMVASLTIASEEDHNNWLADHTPSGASGGEAANLAEAK